MERKSEFEEVKYVKELVGDGDKLFAILDQMNARLNCIEDFLEGENSLYKRYLS